MRKVAARLGLSVPGLYHHVKNQDELLRLAAVRALGNHPPPVYAGQSWGAWLRVYAHYVRSALAAEPVFAEQILTGRLEIEGDQEYVAAALDALVRQGLSAEQALTAWVAVGELAIGGAVEIRRENMRTSSGRPWFARIHALLSRGSEPGLQIMRSLADAGYDPFTERAFDRRLTLLLQGIAAECHLPLDLDN